MPRLKEEHQRFPEEAQLFSAGLKSLVIKIICVGALIRIHPFYWNKVTDRLERRRDGLSLFIWYIHVASSFLYTSFVYFRVLQIRSHSFSTPEQQLVITSCGILFSFPAFFELIIILYGDELASYVNKSLEFIKGYSPVTWGRERKEDKDKPTELFLAELFLHTLWYWFHVLVSMFGVVFFFKPEQPSMISSLCDEPKAFRNLPLRILASVVELQAGLITDILGLTLASVAISFTASILSALRHLREIGFGKISLNLKHYEEMRLLVDSFNQVFGSLYLPAFEIGLIGMSTYGFVGGIRANGEMAYVLAGVGFISVFMVVCIFKFFALYLDRSKEFLLKVQQNPLVDVRVKRRLRPIVAKLGTYYFIDAGMTLTIVDIIFKNTITLLLA